MLLLFIDLPVPQPQETRFKPVINQRLRLKMLLMLVFRLSYSFVPGACSKDGAADSLLRACRRRTQSRTGSESGLGGRAGEDTRSWDVLDIWPAGSSEARLFELGHPPHELQPQPQPDMVRMLR